MTHRAKFFITFDLLADALRLPPDAKIIGVHASVDDVLNKRSLGSWCTSSIPTCMRS
jgi:hypothetical protein